MTRTHMRGQVQRRLAEGIAGVDIQALAVLPQQVPQRDVPVAPRTHVERCAAAGEDHVALI
jgi:hypothetical protein